METIRVLLITDNTIKRNILANGLVREPFLTVSGIVEDPTAALQHLSEKIPDVIVLDTALSDFPLIEFLCTSRQSHAIPVILISPPTTDEALVLEALAAGAVNVMRYNTTSLLKEYKIWLGELCDEIRRAAQITISPDLPPPCQKATPSSFDFLTSENRHFMENDLIVIGASAGGVEALSRLLPLFPPYSPGMVIVQHMPSGYTRRFAERLNLLSQIQIKEAENGDCIRPGFGFLAPGSDAHTIIESSPRCLSISLQNSEKFSGHRPSVDMLFLSAAAVMAKRTAAVLLTGMGADGTKGMLAIRKAGGLTFAQSKESCVVFGMPGSAQQAGAVQEMLSLEEIPARVIQALKQRAETPDISPTPNTNS